MKISIAPVDEINQFKTIEFESVEELGQKACEFNISTSVFKDGYRRINNFERADVIGLDVDNDSKGGTPTLSLAEAVKIFSPFKHIILATRSHRVVKKGIVADRFRIILFLQAPIVRSEDFYATWFYLKEQFPWIDSQCKDPSRFWFKHNAVLSINREGALIMPLHYTAPEKPTKEGRPVLPGERGELSKDTLKFLEFGVESGSRNGTVYKVARDFNQALYEYDEAESRILSALERNKVIASDFTEHEAKIAIGSAYGKDAKHAPRLAEVKSRAFSYTNIGDLLESPEVKEEWVIDKLLLKGGVSIVVGGPKVGKTTLIRQAEKAILRGEKFLGRNCVKGSIFHFSFDEKAKTAKGHYKTLGLTKDDPLSLHFGAAGNEQYLKEFEEDLLKYRPTLVVIDTLFDMVNVEDVNHYSQIKKALVFFNTLAERSGSHIMFIHHQNKPNGQYNNRGTGQSILGSSAIFGSVDCCLILEEAKEKKKRSITVIGRGVSAMNQIGLRFDNKTMTYVLDEVQF